MKRLSVVACSQLSRQPKADFIIAQGNMPIAADGYVYVAAEELGVMAHAYAGANISLDERRPPWLVVDHSIKSITVARWPGRLWRVFIIDAAGIPQASEHARYTRAFEVQTIEELPLSALFGGNGEAISYVIETAAQLELAQVNQLAVARHPDAGGAYSRAWFQWLKAVGDADVYKGENLHRTLGISVGGYQSPINQGFTVIYQLMSKRAEKLVGRSAFITDEDERYFEPTWAAATHAMLEAAMAFGAPMVSEADRKIMMAAWQSVFKNLLRIYRRVTDWAHNENTDRVFETKRPKL